MKKSINQIRTELSEVGNAHQQINTFFWGDLLRAWKENEVEYPLMCCYYPDAAMLTNQTQLQLVVIIADKIYKDWNENLNEIESDTLQICRDIFQTLNLSNRWQKLMRVDSCNVNKFINDTGDEVAGHTMTLTVKLRDNSGICGLPMGDYNFNQLPNVGGECDDATIIDSDSNIIGTTPSGATFTVIDSNVSNSDDSYDMDILATQSLELPDITHTDSDGSPEVLPAQTPMVCTPCVVPSFNSSKLMQTGQTVSYTTGDDITRGRDLDFFTLPLNNPFGNNRRFTGITGGNHDGTNYVDVNGTITSQILAFPDLIILDWSAKNDNEVLTYYINDMASRVWVLANALHLTSTIGGLTNWNLINTSEMSNIIRYESINDPLHNYNYVGYHPFDLVGQRFLWMSTKGQGTLYCRTDLQGTTPISASPESRAYQTVYVRYTTLTELGF